MDILDIITSAANDLTYGNDFSKPVVVVAMVDRVTWYRFQKEICNSMSFIMNPAYWSPNNPIKVKLYNNLDLEIYSSTEMPVDSIKLFIDEANIQLTQKSDDATDKNTLP